MSLLTKIVLLGDGGVGKTTIRNRYLGKGFSTEYLPTLGADFASKQVEIQEKVLKFQIWDLAGQPTFKQIRKLYYAHSVGCLAIFDVTRLKSLHNLENWMSELLQHAESTKISIIILGNKIDKRKRLSKSVSTRKAQKFISKTLKSNFPEFKSKITYIETSAKTGKNIEHAFQQLGRKILETYETNHKQ